MSNLMSHAERELKAAGLFDSDSDYGGMVGTAVMELVEKFSAQGHSGFSASMVISILSKILNYENITPLTDNPEEWHEHDEFWQNKRNSSCFSNDGGKTYYNIVDKERKIVESAKYENPGN